QLPDPAADPQIATADPLPPLPMRLDSAESPRSLSLSQITASPVASDRTAVPTALVPALIDFSRDAGSGTLELSLAPEELGRLHMSLVQDGDMVRVTLVAERPETLDLMRRHADQLSQEFRQAGFSGASLSFGQWGAGGSNQQRPPVASPTNAAPDPAFLPLQLRPGAALGTASGLDLRL
ncbi:MAG: flagellar hook-length control protein FliK, partial [Paracoccaceae bacterium]